MQYIVNFVNYYFTYTIPQFIKYEIKVPLYQLRKERHKGKRFKKFIVQNNYDMNIYNEFPMENAYQLGNMNQFNIYNNIPNYNNNFPNYNNINNININNNTYPNYKNNNLSNNFGIEEQVLKPHEHLRGLVNIASTCYMNSTLQCFAHIGELYSYFKKPKILALIDAPENDNKLFPVFAELITYMWDPIDTSPLYPYIFKEKLGQLNPLFSGALPNDAKDLLTFMLMQLHEELNNPVNNNKINQNMMVNPMIQKDKNAMLKYFSEYFKDNFRSIISALFYGLNFNQTQCQFCKTIVYNYQTFNFLIFPLFEVLNQKMKLVNFQNNFNNTVTLEECFQYNQITQPLSDYYCNICKQTTQGSYSSFISVSPNIIIIILNRGTGLQYNVKIDFEENLDLKNYVEFLKENSFYELIGVVTHYGESGASGHFMARCKSPLDNYWYLYNDAIVEKIGFFTKENFTMGHPYILFYKKTNFANK